VRSLSQDPPVVMFQESKTMRKPRGPIS